MFINLHVDGPVQFMLMFILFDFILFQDILLTFSTVILKQEQLRHTSR